MDKTGRAPGSAMEPELQEFHTGAAVHAYRTFGCHALPGAAGHRFAVWAPHAQRVALVGDFNGWDAAATPMDRLPDGTWVQTVDGLRDGALYKYAVTAPDGQTVLKADPFAAHCETGPATASKVWALEGYVWHDRSYLRRRAARDVYRAPMSIYEVHLGSWRRPETGLPWYRSVADELADYCRTMHYTHVELLPVTEYPYEGSWGYQVTGYYAPTSRYGTAAEFMYFVNYMHKHGIGVILDWVPAHFPKDAHGLADFDGQALYEYADPRKGEHPDWGTKVFDYSRNEVSNFLIANALYWIEQYHIDGLRVDAVASMLYLDYGRTPGNWVPNQYGENKNLEAIEFFRHLNSVVNKQGHGAAVIAEESTAWPMVTGRPEDGGLGFKFKWNMGWMHDFLEYMKLDPYFRKFNHNKMTFGMTYATSENFILVLSHDEVVHLKCSMINKMPGIYEDKFANLKVGYTFMMGHPGKKLLFMGQDFGQFHEWDEKVALDWYLADEPLHKDLQDYCRDLLHLYKKYPACYSQDYDWKGFQWINANDADRSIFSFVRYSATGRQNLLFVCNFTPVSRPDYRVGVPKSGNYTLILDETHGSYKTGDQKIVFKAKKSECDGQPYSIAYPLPAYGTAIFRF